MWSRGTSVGDTNDFSEVVTSAQVIELLQDEDQESVLGRSQGIVFQREGTAS